MYLFTYFLGTLCLSSLAVLLPGAERSRGVFCPLPPRVNSHFHRRTPRAVTPLWHGWDFAHYHFDRSLLWESRDIP